jgi:hypothetical protein
MKIRGSAVAVTLSAVAVLACTFLLFATLRASRPSSHSASGNSAAAARLNSSSTASRADRSKFLEAYGKLPLSFVENQGQTAQEVRYTSHGSQYDLFLTPQEAVVALRHSKHYDFSPRHRVMSMKAMVADRKAAAAKGSTTALRMQFEGANPNPSVTGGEKLPGVFNYYVGNDPQKWHKAVPSFAQVKYSQIYPGVDLVFYGNQGRLEYDFVVAPGADPNVIRMNLAGARKLRVNNAGNVVVSVTDGDLQLQKPVVYQNINGVRHELQGKYSLKGAHVAFAVASYDRREPLIVDPVLVYSTYLGGSSDENQPAFSMVIDASGDAFIGGQTDSTDFPTAGLGVKNTAGIFTGFVSELDPTGATLLQSTTLGGSTGGDFVAGLAIDPSGNVYATGATFATDFPTAGKALKPTLSSNPNGTSFLAESNSSGTLFYSSYLGGSNGTVGDAGNAVVADSSGNAYVTGVTFSTPGTADVDFPVTTSASQSTDPEDGGGSGFLTEINTKASSGSASLVYSSYLGGSGANSATAGLGFGDEGGGIALDSNNHVYITGTTTSTDFPVSATNLQPANLDPVSSAFVSEFDTTKSNAASLVYSTYIGGSGNIKAALGEFANGISVQPGTTVAYFTGTTNSADYPTTSGAVQKTGDSTGGAAYVSLLDTSVGNALNYSTFLGNSGTTGFAIQADTSGKFVVVGGTQSSSFPITVGALQTTIAAGGAGDAFITEIDPSVSGGSGLIYSTYFGGSGNATNGPDQAFGVAIGTLPNVYVSGQTNSTDFPTTTGAFQSALKGNSDSFVTNLNLLPSLSISATSLSFTSTALDNAAPTQTVTLSNNTNTAISLTSVTIANPAPPSAQTDFTITPPAAGCVTSIPANGTCVFTIGYIPSIATVETANLVFVDGDSTSPQTVALSGIVTTIAPDFTISAAPATFTVARGATGTSTITVGSIGTFNSAVTLACSGQPVNSTCTVTPSSVTPAAGSTATAALNLVTVAQLAPPPSALRFPPVALIRVVAPAFLALLAMLLFVSDRRLRIRLATASAVLLLVVLAGCGNNHHGTPTGTVTLTVTGTSGALTHTTTVTATVTK